MNELRQMRMRNSLRHGRHDNGNDRMLPEMRTPLQRAIQGCETDFKAESARCETDRRSGADVPCSASWLLHRQRREIELPMLVVLGVLIRMARFGLRQAIPILPQLRSEGGGVDEHNLGCGSAGEILPAVRILCS